MEMLSATSGVTNGEFIINRGSELDDNEVYSDSNNY